MKSLIFVCLFTLCLADSLQGQEFFGNAFPAGTALSEQALLDQMQQLQVGDSLSVQLKTTVKQVCAKKGCWMTAELATGKELMIRFRDYSFFVPRDMSGKEVVIAGTAYVELMSVADQRHYAEDAGASPAAIAAITKPQRRYSFMADGVRRR